MSIGAIKLLCSKDHYSSVFTGKWVICFLTIFFVLLSKYSIVCTRVRWSNSYLRRFASSSRRIARRTCPMIAIVVLVVDSWLKDFDFTLHTCNFLRIRTRLDLIRMLLVLTLVILTSFLEFFKSLNETFQRGFSSDIQSRFSSTLHTG